jgi:hypothetical protein
MNSKTQKVFAAAVFMLAAKSLVSCTPPQAQQITGNFNQAPTIQVKAEANVQGCQGVPKRIEFEVTLTPRLIPANSQLAASIALSGDAAFKKEGQSGQWLTDNQETRVKLSFTPPLSGPRVGMLTLNVPATTNAPQGPIAVALIGLGTCKSPNQSLQDSDGDGFLDVNDPKPQDPDGDDDGIVAGLEDKNLDGEINRETETDPAKPDTDEDGKKDGDEDKNHNGQIDTGESDPKKKPS